MAPSAAAGTTGLERLLLIFLMKSQQIKLQPRRPSPANGRSSNQSVKNSQTPKNFQNATTTARRSIRTQNLHRNLRSQHKPTASSPKLPIYRSKTRTNGEDFNLPIKTRTISEKLQLSEQELERTEKNFNSPNKTYANGEKPQSTKQKLKRTVKNVKLPIKTSSER